MVQMVENWAEVTGTVRSIGGSGKGPDYLTVAVEVEVVDDLDDFPNLVAGAAGETLLIISRREGVKRAGLAEGSRVRCRVRKATPLEIFAHPEGFTVYD